MKKNFVTGLVTGLAIIAVCAVVALATPGSDDNPLISKDYLDKIFKPEITDYVKEKNAFAVVELKSGQKLIGQAGCELILRQGSATVISTEKGGLADVTAGNDPSNGMAMPANHLLIVPVSDGRGIEATSKVLVMVKGEYEIK